MYHQWALLLSKHTSCSVLPAKTSGSNQLLRRRQPGASYGIMRFSLITFVRTDQYIALFVFFFTGKQIFALLGLCIRHLNLNNHRFLIYPTRQSNSTRVANCSIVTLHRWSSDKCEQFYRNTPTLSMRMQWAHFQRDQLMSKF